MSGSIYKRKQVPFPKSALQSQTSFATTVDVCFTILTNVEVAQFDLARFGPQASSAAGLADGTQVKRKPT
jgi:hypothetical protein